MPAFAGMTAIITLEALSKCHSDLTPVILSYLTFLPNEAKKEREMPRKIGDRYVCEKCGAQLVYEKPCPCPEGMPHSEICCGEQMKLVQEQAPAKTDKE